MTIYDSENDFEGDENEKYKLLLKLELFDCDVLFIEDDEICFLGVIYLLLDKGVDGYLDGVADRI